MKEFKKQLTDFENSLKNRDQAFKNVINSSDFLTAEQKSQLINSVEKKLASVLLCTVTNGIRGRTNEDL